MEIVSSLIQNLVFIIILAIIMEMFLPMGEMKKYVKMVMGLLIIVAVVQAVVELTDQNYAGDFPFLTQKEDYIQTSGVIEAGKKISSEQTDRAIENYCSSLSRQVIGLARLNKEADVAGATVKVQSEANKPGFGQIIEIILMVRKESVPQDKITKTSPAEGVETVSVEVGRALPEEGVTGPGPPRESVENLINTVANFYNLKPERVKVIYTRE